MAQTKIEMLLALKDRYSAVLKRADNSTETATQRMKQRFSEIKERFADATTNIKTNVNAAFSDVRRQISDPSYRRASILIAMHELKDKINGVKTATKNAFAELIG